MDHDWVFKCQRMGRSFSKRAQQLSKDAVAKLTHPLCQAGALLLASVLGGRAAYITSYDSGFSFCQTEHIPSLESLSLIMNLLGYEILELTGGDQLFEENFLKRNDIQSGKMWVDPLFQWMIVCTLHSWGNGLVFYRLASQSPPLSPESDKWISFPAGWKGVNLFLEKKKYFSVHQKSQQKKNIFYDPKEIRY